MNFDRLSRQYKGEAARNYNASRQGGAKWRSEEQAFKSLLGQVPEGLKTLDVPVGTGRLFPYCREHCFVSTGVDISEDMLTVARERAEEVGLNVELLKADIRKLPFPAESFDLVMCIRFLNWVDIAGLSAALAELTLVSRNYLMIGVRHYTPLRDLRPQPRDLIRLVRRSLGHAEARARRSGLVYHQKAELESVFSRLGLAILAREVVEKRSDATDYNIYLLQKRRTA